jgi:DNA-binding CsgD family transcriptional regulator
MNVKTQSLKTLDSAFELNSSGQAQFDAQVLLLQGILEGMPDGILIVSEHGRILQSNYLGRRLCEQLIERPTPIDAVPKAIHRLCEALLDSLETFAGDAMPYFLIEEDVQTKDGITIRVRVRWFSQDSSDFRILVVLEDRFQTARVRAIAEGQRYGLTEREAEVWQYRCIGYTYKQISEQLFITVDTVKKHVKSIYAKRETFQLMSEEKYRS